MLSTSLVLAGLLYSASQLNDSKSAAECSDGMKRVPIPFADELGEG